MFLCQLFLFPKWALRTTNSRKVVIAAAGEVNNNSSSHSSPSPPDSQQRETLRTPQSPGVVMGVAMAAAEGIGMPSCCLPRAWGWGYRQILWLFMLRVAKSPHLVLLSTSKLCSPVRQSSTCEHLFSPHYHKREMSMFMQFFGVHVFVLIYIFTFPPPCFIMVDRTLKRSYLTSPFPLPLPPPVTFPVVTLNM